MTALTDNDLGGRASAYYWAGYLSSALRGVGTPGWDKANREWALREYDSSPVARPRPIVAFAVVARNGECYAIRETLEEAETARSATVDYLMEALASAHPKSGKWVDERLPFATVTIDADERDEMLDNGTPVLDREP